MYQWDPQNQALIFTRSIVDDSSAPLWMYDERKAQALEIFAFRDVPRAKKFQLWAASGTPDSGVVISAVLELEDGEFSSVMLTYDLRGKLTRLWDMYPYHHTDVATDALGNVYAFGTRVDRSEVARKDEPPDEPPYPVLLKYSRKGRLVSTLLLSDYFRGLEESGDPDRQLGGVGK